MQLLNETIELLAAKDHNLTDALIKTKVLLHKLGRKELASWVNQELNGYGSADTVPSYRMIHGTVKGNLSGFGFQADAHPLPTMHLDPTARARFEDLEMRQSISILENLAAQGSGSLSVAIPIEANHLLQKALTPGTHILSAWSAIGHGQIAGILTQVRSRLLDFLLALDEQVDENMTDDDVRELGQQPAMTSMFSNAIFGDNVVISVGHNNLQNVTNSVTTNDFASLVAMLTQLNVPAKDVDDLRHAIESDAGAPEHDQRRFGPGVREWISRMVSKAIDTSWAIELSIAANLLTDALKAYYGWMLP